MKGTGQIGLNRLAEIGLTEPMKCAEPDIANTVRKRLRCQPVLIGGVDDLFCTCSGCTICPNAPMANRRRG